MSVSHHLRACTQRRHRQLLLTPQTSQASHQSRRHMPLQQMQSMLFSLQLGNGMEHTHTCIWQPSLTIAGARYLPCPHAIDRTWRCIGARCHKTCGTMSSCTRDAAVCHCDRVLILLPLQQHSTVAAAKYVMCQVTNVAAGQDQVVARKPCM